MIRPPIVGAEIWRKVMSAAGYQCQCEGACAKAHICDRRAVPGQPPLVVAPADVPMTAFAAARLPATELRAWCARCYSGALAVARRQAKAEPVQVESLFDGQPAQTVVCASDLHARDCVCAVDLPDGTHLDIPERPEVLAARTLPDRHVTVVAYLDRDAEALPETARVTVIRRGAA